MSIFSVNQASQIYVVSAYDSALPTPASTTGKAFFKKGVDGKIRLGYKGVAGVSSSPSFTVGEIVYSNAKKAEDLAKAMKKYKVALSDTLVAGQTYLLRITVRGFVGISQEYQHQVYGEVLATSSMTSEGFYQALKASLDKNVSKFVSPLFSFALDGVKASATMATNTGVTVTANTLGTAGNSLKFAVDSVSASEAALTVATVSGVTTITASLTAAAKTIADLKALVAANTDLVTITGTDATTVAAEATAVALTGGSTTGVIVEEVEQPWILGKFPQEQVNFTVEPTYIKNSAGLSVIWGTVSKETPTTSVKNGKSIADLEYFLMGERGDIYRKMAFPHNIDTTYLVDSSKEYDVLTISYAIKGNPNEGVQGQQQSIVIVAQKSGVAGHEHDLINSIITGLNTAAGSTVVATLA